MAHNPADSRFPSNSAGDGLNSRRSGFYPEQRTEVAFPERMRMRTTWTPQHGSTTTHLNAVEHEFAQAEGEMRCPHILYNPQLPSKHHSCEEMFSDMETLKSHIRDIHGYSRQFSIGGATQRENYEAIWKELFVGYHGAIPPASGISSDDMRKMQNLRMYEIVVRYIWNQLGPLPKIIQRGQLEDILNRFPSTNDLLLDTDAKGFKWNTDIPEGTGALRQHIWKRQGERHHQVTMPHGQDLGTTQVATRSAVPKQKPWRQLSDEPMTTEQFPSPMGWTSPSIDERNVAEIMDKFWELTGFCSDPDYEDDESAEEQSTSEQPSPRRTGTQSIHTWNGPSDAGEGSGRTRNGADRNGSSWVASTRGPSNRNPKRGHGGSSSGGNDDEDGEKKRRKQGNIRGKATDKSVAKFACPYAKHAPSEPFKAASCCYPGFPSVSRVKEHIYRTHAALIQCPRCFQEFHDEDGLTNHLRDAAICEQRPDKPDTKTITVEQERKLRSKMKSDDSEEKKWKQVYRIVFNVDDATETPDPYNDLSSSSFELFSRYEKHSRDALPSLVENEVRRLLSHGPIDMGNSLKHTLVNIVLTCQENLFTSFREYEENTTSQAVYQSPQNDQYSYIDPSFFNPEIWDFNVEEAGLGGYPSL